jgi:hypothetical protein
MRHQHPLLLWIVGVSFLLISLLGTIQVGREHGWLWGTAHFVLFWLGLVALCALLFLSVMLHEWLRRGGPLYPPCHNGTCKGRRWLSLTYKDWGDYQRVVADGESVLRCKCGRDYVCDLPGRRFLERLPDGTRKPYMVHRPFRGWFPDSKGTA